VIEGKLKPRFRARNPGFWKQIRLPKDES
jgi:hypothetical protein